MKQTTLEEIKRNPGYDKEKLADTVLRGALVDRCCGCAAPGKGGPKSAKSSRTSGSKQGSPEHDDDDGSPTKKGRHWHCIREKNTFLHVECNDSECDICEVRQRAATFDAIDCRDSRALLAFEYEHDSLLHSKEEPAGTINVPMSMSVESAGDSNSV